MHAEPSPPSACSQVLGACAGDIVTVQSLLGLSSPSQFASVSPGTVQEKLGDAKGRISGACCKAACEANRQVGTGWRHCPDECVE